MLASPRTQYFTIRSKRIHGMLRWCTYTLLSEPSSHVILNALNLKAFICNRIITAGTVIRFAVSPKRIYSSRTGNVGAESRVHPGSRDFRSSSCSTQEHRSASKLSILIATSFKRRSQMHRRDYGDNGTSVAPNSILIVRDIAELLAPHVCPRLRHDSLFSRNLTP